jgi:hypothetical protein
MKYTTGDIPEDIFSNLNERAMTKLKEIQQT